MPTSGDFGDPAYGLLRWAWETVPGVPPVAGWHDIIYSGETFANEAQRLEREAITRGAMTKPPLKGKFNVPAGFTVDALNPNQDWGPLAAIIGSAADPDEVETDTFVHKLSRLETDVSFPKTQSFAAWRNDDMGQRFCDARFNSLAFTWAAGALIGANYGIVAKMGDYWEDPTRTVGTGTVKPQVRGLFQDDDGGAYTESATTKNLYIKIIADDATTVTFKAKIGDATTYDGANQIATKGEWLWVRDQDDVRIGDRALKIEAYFSAGIDGTFVNDDIFKFLHRRGEWVPSYVDDTLACLEVYSAILWNGDEFEVESGGLTIAKGAEAKAALGGRGPRRTRSRGQQLPTWSIQREYLDKQIRRALDQGEPVALVAEINSGVKIGTTGDLYYGFRFVSPYCIATGPTATVTSKDEANESIELTAHPSEDGTDPADISVYITTDIPDLEAA